MTKKKTAMIISVSMAVLAVVIIVTILFLTKDKNRQTPETPMLLYPWNNRDIQYAVCYGYAKDETDYSGLHSRYAYLKTELSLEELIATNNEDYQGQYTFYDEYLEEYEAALFYSNNNYCVLYPKGQDKSKTFYCAENLEAQWALVGFETAGLYFPCPIKMRISQSEIKWAQSRFDNTNYLNRLFDNYTFEECREFYGKLDSQLCLIDEEAQTITVKAYQNTDNTSFGKGYFYDITINFKDRSISGPYNPKDPKTITLYGDEEFDSQ